MRSVSFICFMLLGLVHFMSSLLFTSGYATRITATISRISLIPFVAAALFYLYASVRAHFGPKTQQNAWLDYAFIGTGAVMLLTLIAVEFLTPDSPGYL